MATIRIDEEVYGWLQNQGRAFEDTPNSVLRRIAGLDKPGEEPKSTARPRGVSQGRGAGKTPQGSYRAPILKILTEHGGQAARTDVLASLEDRMSEHLTSYDKEDIESGGPRWQKSAEWEVRVMREANLLKAAKDAPRGYWALTKLGEAAAAGS